jgi:hypothetical protein
MQGTEHRLTHWLEQSRLAGTPIGTDEHNLSPPMGEGASLRELGKRLRRTAFNPLNYHNACSYLR